LGTTQPDFSDTLCSAIDETILEVLGHTARDTLYAVLKTKYDISRDELPYRTEAMYHVLETNFGVFGAKTVGPQIARKFYKKLGLTFYEHQAYTLVDYVEDAKTKLSKS
jgi:hypothetical protein